MCKNNINNQSEGVRLELPSVDLKATPKKCCYLIGSSYYTHVFILFIFLIKIWIDNTVDMFR